MAPAFIPGLELSRIFYEEAVRPILAKHWPALPHSVALLGPGSDVQGFDTEQSMDHDWGPRLQLFLADDEYAIYVTQIDHALRFELPLEIRGFSTNFGLGDDGVHWMDPAGAGPVNHGVKILPLRTHFRDKLGCDPTRDLRPVDWLLAPSQVLREVTGGRIFHDDLGLNQIRERLRYYPHQVWLYLLAAQWTRIGQEEPFMGRTAQAGDSLGSRILAARLARDLIHLAFLLERQYAPYIKWLGTAFARLNIATRLGPILSDAMDAPALDARERALCAAYELLAQAHNALGVTPPGSTQVQPFFNRPFLIIQGGAFAGLAQAAITDPEVLAWPRFLGAAGQFADSTDLLTQPALLDRLRAVYRKPDNSAA